MNCVSSEKLEINYAVATTIDLSAHDMKCWHDLTFMVITLTHVTNGNPTKLLFELMLRECQRRQRASVPDSGFV